MSVTAHEAGKGAHALSMHQPWASLLVHGIKRIEGRTWPTNLRGRVWIHATAQEPGERLIQEVEAHYRQVWALEGVEPALPQHYPKGVLLGCVDIVDCLPVESIEAWPGLPESARAEAGSPFGFLCESPQRLVVPQAMRGSQRFWRLPAKLARDLEPALRPMPPVAQERWSWLAFPQPQRQPNEAPSLLAAASGQRGKLMDKKQPTSASTQLRAAEARRLAGA